MTKPNSQIDKIGTINPRIDLKVSGVVGLISVLLIILYTNKPDWRKNLEFIASTLTAGAAIASAIYFVRNSEHESKNREKELKIDRALALNNRWHQISQVNLNDEVLSFIAELQNKADVDKYTFIHEKFESKDKNVNLKQQIVLILNFFEELAIAVENEVVDEKIVFDSYKSIISRYYNLFSTWIVEIRRLGNNNRYYKSLESLYQKWN